MFDGRYRLGVERWRNKAVNTDTLSNDETRLVRDCGTME